MSRERLPKFEIITSCGVFTVSAESQYDALKSIIDKFKSKKDFYIYEDREIVGEKKYDEKYVEKNYSREDL